MSNTERATKEVETPSGRKLVVKTFVTQGEKNQITEIYLDGADKNKAGTPLTGENRPSFRADAKAIELVVVSLDGDPENIVSRLINDMPAVECEEVEEIVKGIIEPKKKAPNS